MTRETVSLSLQEALSSQTTDEVVLAFLTITHPDIGLTIRVVSDGADYVRGGETWIGLPFDVTFPNDTDRAPQASLKIPNVDRMIGDAIMSMGAEPARVKLELLSSLDFDTTVNPRQEIGTAHVSALVKGLFLVGVSVNAIEVTGTLRSWDYSQEIFPAVSATRDRLPGLYV